MNKAKFNLQQPVNIDETDNDTLIIRGVAADINKDRYDNYLTSETMKSLCEQAKNTNLHLNHDSDKIIGRNYDAEIENNQLIVKSKILPEYAKKLKEELEFGINYAESIKGIATKNMENGEIVDYDLLEISITDTPVNQNTYATVQIDDQKSINTSCLGGLCHILEKEEKDMDNQLTKDDVNDIVSEKLKEYLEGKYVTVDDLNNAFNEYKEDTLNTLREELKGLVAQAILDAKKMEEPEQQMNAEEPAKQVPLNNVNPEQVQEMVASSINDRFNAFEEKFFQHADANRNPEANKQYTREMNQKSMPEENRTLKLPVKDIAKFITNGGE